MTPLGIDFLLDYPLYLGALTTPSSLVPWVLPCSLADRPYQIDFSKFRRTTLPIRRAGTDDSVEPGESTLNASGVWPRAQDNWFLGAGQKFLDNRFAFESVYVHSGEYPSVRTRFWKSQGVNPWNEGQMTLHNEYESIATSTTRIVIIGCGAYLYKTDGPTLSFAHNPTTGVPSWTTVTTANTQPIVSITSDGSRVWIACGSDGVYVTTAGSTTSAAAATPAALTAPQGLHETDGVGTVGTHLPASTATTWSVTAVDAFGKETTATTVTETTAATPLPAQLTWNANSNASSFNVYRTISTTTDLIGNVDTPTFTDDGSVAGTLQSPPGSNQTGTSVYQATFIAYVKGYLIASTGRDLVNILASGSVQFIFEHESPGFTWVTVCEAPTAIIVGGYAGTSSYIGAIQPDPATNGATLSPPITATTLPVGEAINDIAYSAGSILMGTSLGIRSGTAPDATGVFDVNPVIEDPGNCLCATPWLQYMYFGFSNYDPTEPWATRPTVAGTGRADLSQFTTSGVPGFATDVMSTVAGAVTQIVLLGGTPYFVVETSSSAWSLWGPDGLFVESGWFEAGEVRFGTVEPKILVEVDLQHRPLLVGESINFQVVDEFENVINIGSSNVVGSTTVDEPLLTGLQVGNRFQPWLTLTAGTSKATTPTLLSWIGKGVVVPRRQDEILLPIILYTEVATYQPADQFHTLDPYDEFLEIKKLEAAGAPFTFTFLGDSHQVYIDQVMLGDAATTVTDDRTFINTICVVKLLTLD